MEYIAESFAENELIYSTHGTEMSQKVNEIEDDNTIQFARADQLIPGSVNTFPRAIASGTGNALPGSGILPLTYFTAEQSLTVNNVFTRRGSTAAGANPTITRFGLYTVAANGDLTLVASTANDATLFVSTATVNKALSAGYSVVAGQRYAAGWLIVTAAAMPTIIGAGSITLSAAEMGLAPRLTGQVSGQSDLPSSVANASVADSSANSYLYYRLYT